MPRYVIRACPDCTEDDYPIARELTVEEQPYQDTGLIDRHGNKIMRAPHAIGFHATIED